MGRKDGVKLLSMWMAMVVAALPVLTPSLFSASSWETSLFSVSPYIFLFKISTVRSSKKCGLKIVPKRDTWLSWLRHGAIFSRSDQWHAFAQLTVSACSTESMLQQFHFVV